MKITPGHIVALVIGLGALLAFDRWSTREDRWRAELAATAARVRSEDSVSYHALRERAVRDSLRVDSLTAAYEAEEATRIRLGQDNGRLRVELRDARTMPDTVRVQAAIIAKQDTTIRSDSAQKATLRTTIATQAGTIVDLTTNLNDARRRLADLVGVAERPPKEIKLLGLTLSLKPYLGVGLNVSPQGKAAAGLQLGVSILRG